MKYYRLLRNNKETGPFSAEELIKTGFKAYDLIWEEGKSASWRYPSEISEFKTFAPVVEEQPFDRFYKKPASPLQPKMPENSISVKVVSESIRKEKPRIKIKAECKKLDTAADIQSTDRKESQASQPVSQTQIVLNQNTSARAQTISPDWEKMWLDWEQEKKSVGSLKSGDDKEPQIETKYSQSLDDLKELYVEKVLKGKQASFSFDRYKNYIAIIVISGFVLTLGIWMGVKWSNNDETKLHLRQVDQGRPEESQQLTVQATDNNTVSDNNSTYENGLRENETSKVIIVPTVQNDNISKQKKIQNKKTNSLPQKVGSQHSVLSQKNSQSENILSNPGSTITKNAERKKVVNTINKNQNNVPSKKFITSEKNINDYIAIRSSSNPGAAEASYKVENISDITVELVMIDLQYYDAAGRFKKGETVYVRDINPGAMVSIKAPNDAATPTITPKISMISSEAKNLYLIAE